MAVTTTTSSVSYVGNGATVDFPTGFKFLAKEHLVVRVTPSGGVESVKALGTDYTVNGAGDDAGGTVHFLAAPANLSTVVIDRETPIEQTTNFRNFGSFSPAVHEARFDERAIVDQELERRVSAIENRGTTNNAVAGDGLYVSGDGKTWHVGNGEGLVEYMGLTGDGSDGDVRTSNAGPGETGVMSAAARADHKHEVEVAAPGPVRIGDAAAEGADNKLARADHQHAMAAPGAPVNVNKTAADPGASVTPARADHKHDISTAAATDLTDNSNTEGNSTSLARSNHTHAHGARGGGNLHAAVTAGANGFMVAADKQKLDAYGPAASGTATTNDAAPTVILNIDLPKGDTYTIDLMVAALRNDFVQGAGYRMAATFRNQDSAAVQIGATTVMATHEDAAAWDVQFAVAGQTVQVKVIGAAATTIQWRARARICEAP
jgi:hypothetical protein